MSEEIKQSWHQRLRQWCVRQWDKSKPVITKILYILLALALLGVALTSLYSLAQRVIDTSLIQNALGILKSPLALIPALALLLVLWQYPSYQDFKKQIALSILCGAGAVLFVILCGLEMGIDFQKLIEKHPPWIYMSAVAAVPAVILTWYWRQVNNAKKQDYDEYSEINERFSKATEMLGSEIMEQRIGAIYQLEGIAQDSPKNHWTVMETLCAFVRERSPRKSSDYSIEEDFSASDIRAAMKVIGHSKQVNEKMEPNRLLDFHNTNLKGLSIFSGRFPFVNFISANFEMALLHGTDFEGAFLSNANFKSANIAATNFNYASLDGADFKEAIVSNAKFTGTKYDNKTIFPDGFNPADHGMINVDEVDDEQPDDEDAA